MINYSTLENVSIEELHNTFKKAFSDYEIEIDIPITKLHQRLQRTGYIAETSIGAYYNGILVGFLLNSIRKWNGKLTAYDTGTGVIEEYRNNGITSNMFINSVKILKEMDVDQWLLEVIQSNVAAVHLYKKQGFEISREFDCFNLDKNSFTYKVTHQVQHIDTITEIDWMKLMSFWDFKPSWQNSIDSINAVADEFVYSTVSINDEIVGYGIIDKKTGDIPQIAVNKKYRCRGIGSSILADLLKSTESSDISVANVDSKCASTKVFLLNLGFRQVVKQYEMILDL